jgi:periplasmic copper chaperone A
MKKLRPFILIGMAFLFACSNSLKVQEVSQDPSQLDDICGVTNPGEISTGIMPHDFWVNSALKGEDSDAYMLIHNHSLIDDSLMGISSSVAEHVEIHQSRMSNEGNMEMIPEAALALPAKYMVEVLPGSYHFMLIGLNQNLNVGDKIVLTLQFQNYTEVDVVVPIKNW